MRNAKGNSYNYGFMIRYANLNESGDYNLIASGDHDTASMRPSIAIGYTGSSANPAKPGRTIADGTYFIRNLYSGKYLDVLGSGAVNKSGVGQYDFTGNTNQQWRITYGSDGYYRISPVHAPSKALDMRSEAASKVNGTEAQIYQYESKYQEQKWIIHKATGGGYEFITKASSSTSTPKALEITSSSTANGAKAQIWTSSTSRTNDNWTLREVTTAEYFFTPDKDKPKMEVINPIINKIKSLGHYTIYTEDVTAKTALERFGNRKINIVHGHGSPESVSFPTNRVDTALYALQASNGSNATLNSLTSTALKNCDLMVFLYCNGGTRKKDGAPSITEVAYNKGVKTTLVFNVSVSMAEDYFNYVMNYVKSGASFGNALAKADNDFNRDCWYQVLPNLSPATPNHRSVCGNQNIVLAPTYWS